MSEKTYKLFRGPISEDRFDIMEVRDGDAVGLSKSFVSEELARACDDLEQLNHMRRVCAWCGAVLQEGEEPTSHGICRGCAAKELEEINGPSDGLPATQE